MGSGIAGELAEPCQKASRYGGTPACSKEPTGLYGALAYSMNSQGLHRWSTGIPGALAWVVGWQVSLQNHVEKPAGMVGPHVSVNMLHFPHLMKK